VYVEGGEGGIGNWGEEDYFDVFSDLYGLHVVAIL
jgi:hypothetical protein